MDIEFSHVNISAKRLPHTITLITDPNVSTSSRSWDFTSDYRQEDIERCIGEGAEFISALLGKHFVRSVTVFPNKIVLFIYKGESSTQWVYIVEQIQRLTNSVLRPLVCIPAFSEV